MITALTLNVTSGNETIVLENKYKASFIFKFVEHIKLPKIASKDISIGVFGKTPVLNELKKIAKINNEKLLSVNDICEVEALTKCALVFLPSSEEKHFHKIHKQLKNRDTLLVTENYDLIKKGADISFYTKDNKLKFEINRRKLSLKNNISNILLNKADQ